jgi:nucleoside-diphosphate-sugar epimerase
MKTERDMSLKCQPMGCDLLDRNCLEEKLRDKLNGVTHMYYCALSTCENKHQEVDINTRMFRNALEVTELCARDLKHVFLMSGSKWYGVHLGPAKGYKIPSVENQPRLDAPVFYYAQQDLLEEKQKGKKWTWSSARPNGVVGFITCNAMNVGTSLAVYATILKEQGKSLVFPGGLKTYQRWRQFCDADLLCHAIIWMSTTDQCKNQAFNVDNGDSVKWEDLWCDIASYFKMECSVPVDASDVTALMKDQENIWKSTQNANRLKTIPLKDVVTWDFLQYYTNADWDFQSDYSKLRTFGFSERADSKKMLIELFDRLKRDRVIAGAESVTAKFVEDKGYTEGVTA